jgi:hypothetical protein
MLCISGRRLLGKLKAEEQQNCQVKMAALTAAAYVALESMLTRYPQHNCIKPRRSVRNVCAPMARCVGCTGAPEI